MAMTANEPSSFLHLLPMYSATGMVATEVVAVPAPWGGFLASAVGGHDPGDVSIKRLDIGYEMPIPWMRIVEPLSNFDLEWLHVQRFRSDFSLARGSHAFSNVRRGDDPPDILVDTPDGIVGIECTRFAIESRQRAHGLFFGFRRRLLEVEPAHFSKLAGQIVYAWFGEGDWDNSLPHPPTDKVAIDALVKALMEYQPEPDAMRVSGTEIPDQAPRMPTGGTPQGASFYSIPLIQSVPDSFLFNVAGFELGLAYSTGHDSLSDMELLKARVKSKDRPGNHWLLISAGAPDHRGMIYPAEEILANFILRNLHLDLKLEHLRMVIIHFWSSGRAVAIYPVVENIFGPLYSFAAPAFRNISTPEDDPGLVP